MIYAIRYAPSLDFLNTRGEGGEERRGTTPPFVERAP